MRILFGNGFKKKSDKQPKKVRLALAKRLRVFVQNPFDQILNNHKLHGERRHQRSVNITGSYRLVFEQIDPETVLLIDIDTHPNLYNK